MFFSVTNDNIIQVAKDFIEKAKTKLEKPKDDPRYKVIVQYEAEFKTKYAKGLNTILDSVLTQYTEMLIQDAP